MQKKAYSYIRFSRREQEDGDSFRRQSEAAAEWAKKNGYVIDETLTDRGVSAYRGKNRRQGALGRFLDAVQAKIVPEGSVLIVESLDRFSREELMTSLMVLNGILEAGISVAVLTDNRLLTKESLTTDLGSVFSVVAEMQRSFGESHRKSGMVGGSWAKKRKLARETGTVLTKRAPAWLDVVGEGAARTFEENKKHGPIVRRIFAETAAGYGRRTIVARLNAEGVPPFRSEKGWHPSYVAKIIRSRAVIGEYVPPTKDGEDCSPIQNYFPVIVDRALFVRANAALDARRKAGGPRTEEVANVLPGIARCAKCGQRMTALNKGAPPKGGRYFACSNAVRRAGCENDRRWRFEQVEGILVNALSTKQLFDAIGEVTPAHAQVRDLEVRVAELEERYRNARELAEKGGARSKARVLEIERELERWETDLAAAREAADRASHALSSDERARSVGALRALLASDDLALRSDARRRLSQAVRETFETVAFGPDYILGHVPGHTINGVPLLVDGKPSHGVVILASSHVEWGVEADHWEAVDREMRESGIVWRPGSLLPRYRMRHDGDGDGDGGQAATPRKRSVRRSGTPEGVSGDDGGGAPPPP